MEINLAGRTALVTGGNVGIGAAIALALADCGVDVALTYLTHEASDTVERIERIGRKALAVRLDATDSNAVNQAAARAAAFLDGHLDILINNAGGMIARVATLEMDDTHWRRVLDVNLSSAFYCARAVVPFMSTGWGRIVNVSSLAAQSGGGQGAVAYAAAKAGLLGLTRGLANELAPRGITVNAVAPGIILETPFHATFTPEAAQRATIAGLPLKRAGVPLDVAGAVMFLVSELGAFITGVTVDINGGARYS